jgi:hypothetical protein
MLLPVPLIRREDRERVRSRVREAAELAGALLVAGTQKLEQAGGPGRVTGAWAESGFGERGGDELAGTLQREATLHRKVVEKLADVLLLGI